LPDVETLSDHPASETLHDNTTPPPEETVCFQRDLAAWLTKLTERDRGIVKDLRVGEPTRDVADKYGVTPACLAQRRRAFCQECQAFYDELSALAASSALGVACVAIQQTLEGQSFRSALRQAVRQVIRQYPDLNPIRIRLSG
jgi:hypothetical protein